MFSGRWSAINGIGNVGSWTVTETAQEEKFVNSATKNGTDRLIGTRDVSGSYEASGGLPSVLPGESFQFIGYTSPTNNTKGTAGMRYTVDAIVTSVSVTWDYVANKMVKHTVQFGGVGAVAVASGAAIVDATAVKKINSLVCPMVYASATPLVSSRTQVVLTITNDAAGYSNAGTLNNTVREPGNTDWTLAITRHGHDVFLPVGTYVNDIKLGVDAVPNSWWLQHGIVTESTNITCKPGSSTIETQTVNIAMLASHPTTGVVGFIRKPGEVVANWWG